MLRSTMSDIRVWVKLWHPMPLINHAHGRTLRSCGFGPLRLLWISVTHPKTSYVSWTGCESALVLLSVLTSPLRISPWTTSKRSSLRSCKFSSSAVSDMAQGQPWRWRSALESKEHHPPKCEDHVVLVVVLVDHIPKFIAGLFFH